MLIVLLKLLYFDKIYLYAKNLEQGKYQTLKKALDNRKVGYKIIETSNDEITPLDELAPDNQKIVIFDDFVCEKNQSLLINHFIRGRHKKCSVIYLSQSYLKSPKGIRLNCSHFVIYEFPSQNEVSLLCRDQNVTKKTIPVRY